MNEKGISLVSVVIAAGLMGLLGVFMMRMQENQLKTQNDMMARSEIGLFMTTINNALAKPGYCEKSLKGKAVGPRSEVLLEKIVTPNDQILYQVGEVYGQGHFKLLSIGQKSFTYDDEDKNSGILTLDVSLEKRKKAFGAKVIRRELAIMVELDQGKVYDCGTLGSVAGGSGPKSRVDLETVQKVISNDGTDAKKTASEEEVKKIIENNENLKMMQEAIRSMKETNEKSKKLEEEYRKNDGDI